MGTWGAGIFSDDTTVDIRETYRRLLLSEVGDAEAAAAVIEHFKDELDRDEQHLLWLGLAAAQHEVGRLQDDVRDSAIQMIDDGIGLERWTEADVGQLALRRRSLAALGVKLSGPQPSRRALRKQWAYATGLTAGEVLSHIGIGGRVTLWRVARVEVDWHLRVPLLQQVDWSGGPAPEASRFDALLLLPNLRLRSRPVTSWFVTKHRKGDPDWSESGFKRLGRSSPRPDDEKTRGFGDTTWQWMHGALTDAETMPR